MEASGKEQDVPGRVPDSDQLPAMTGNLTGRKTGPVLVVENTQDFTNPGAIAPSGAKHNGHVEVDDSGLPADFSGKSFACVADIKGPGSFGHGSAIHGV